jgi:hypothetical protein
MLLRHLSFRHAPVYYFLSCITHYGAILVCLTTTMNWHSINSHFQHITDKPIANNTVCILHCIRKYHTQKTERRVHIHQVEYFRYFTVLLLHYLHECIHELCRKALPVVSILVYFPP